MRDWQGKTYWLVGGSEGLGRELAFCLSRVGAKLVLSARSEDRLDSLVQSLPGQARALPMDVTDPEAARAAVRAAGEIDGMVYLAGSYWPMRAQAWDQARLEEMAQVNYLGAARLASMVVPGFVERGHGHLVLTGALSAFRGRPGSLGHGASKAAVMHLAESLRQDLRDTGVDVQLVNPGTLRTRLAEREERMAGSAMEPARAAREMFEHMSTDRFKINFPYGVSLLHRGVQFLPDWAYFRVLGQR